MSSPQYTGNQSETGMVLMEVEMVSGSETFASRIPFSCRHVHNFFNFTFNAGWEARFPEIESLVKDANNQIQRVERCNQHLFLPHQKTFLF